MKEPKRFWSKVDVGEPDECWEWLASKTTDGRGRFGINYRLWLSHRVAWVLTYGPIPEGLLVCHHCDNPGCCNPYHLFLGTPADNLADAARKGRMSRGEDRNTAKLTEEEVREIRDLISEGNSQRNIAARYGVSHRCVGDIQSGKSWRWLT